MIKFSLVANSMEENHPDLHLHQKVPIALVFRVWSQRSRIRLSWRFSSTSPAVADLGRDLSSSASEVYGETHHCAWSDEHTPQKHVHRA